MRRYTLKPGSESWRATKHIGLFSRPPERVTETQADGASWWVGVSREDWRSVVAHQFPRMATSRYGQMQDLTLGPRSIGLAERASIKRREYEA